jgi:hypothetical protein
MRIVQQIGSEILHLAAAWHARWGKLALHALRWGVPILLLVFLGLGLSKIGWGRVWDARPRALGFYLVLFLQFFVQPIADIVIYRNLLQVGRALPLTVLLRKRFLNSYMLDYSGEAYFFFWAKEHLELKKNRLLHAVKDTNILSAGAGLVMVWLILLALVASGGVKLPVFLSANFWTLALLGSLPLVLCLALVVGGRRVTMLQRREIASTFVIHLVRSVAALAFEFAFWWFSGALPSAAVCMEFIALRLLITRLPLIPNKDLIFIGVGMATAGLMDLSAPRVTAVLVIMTAFDQIQGVILVGLPWLFEQFQNRRRVGQGAA